MKLVLLALWFIALPYLSRLPQGTEWMLMYLPDEGALLFGLALFSAFNCLPAFVAMAALKGMQQPANRRWALLPFIVMSAATVWAHYDYDLASDAQAAIWLIIAPLFVSFLGGVSIVLSLALAWLTGSRTRQSE